MCVIGSGREYELVYRVCIKKLERLLERWYYYVKIVIMDKILNNPSPLIIIEIDMVIEGL